MNQTEQNNAHVRQLIGAVLALGTDRAIEVIERLRNPADLTDFLSNFITNTLSMTKAVQEMDRSLRVRRVDLNEAAPAASDLTVIDKPRRRRNIRLRSTGSQPTEMTFLTAVHTILKERGQSTGKQIAAEIRRRGWKFKVREPRAYISHLASTHKDLFFSVSRGVYRAVGDKSKPKVLTTGKRLKERLLKLIENAPFARTTTLVKKLGDSPVEVNVALDELFAEGVLKLEKIHGHRCWGLTAPVSE